MTNEKECCSDCRVRTDLGEYCKYPKCSCHSHTQEVVAKIEGMRAENDDKAHHPQESEEQFYSYNQGYNTALHDVLALLKENNK